MKRWRAVLRWLGPVALLWAGLAVLARIPTREAATVTDVLFVVALLGTYAAVVGAAIQASSRRELTTLRAAALTLGLCMGLAVLEVAAAARLVHWQLLFDFIRGEQQNFVPDADLGFRHEPSTQWSGRPRSDGERGCGLPASTSHRIMTTYNERGFRTPATLIRAPVVLIGDSYVEGRYVSDEHVVSRSLQVRLSQPVANLGVAGYGTAQELIVLKTDAMPLEPKVVIWFFFEGNDLYNDEEFEHALVAQREVRAGAWTSQHGWWRRSFVRHALPELRLLVFPLAPRHCPGSGIMAGGPHRGQKLLFGSEAGAQWTKFEEARWERAKQTLREAARFTEGHDIRLLVVYIPIKFRVYRDFVDFSPGEVRDWTLWPLPDLFADFCRTEGMPCLDLTGLLRDAVGRGAMPYALADSHWSPEGHELVAHRLADLLASFGWLPSPRRAE